MYLQYILKRDENELLCIFFTAQETYSHPKKDVVSTVKKDLKALNINLNFEEIKKKILRKNSNKLLATLAKVQHFQI